MSALRRLFRTVGHEIQAHPVATLLIAALLLVTAFGGAAQITSVTGDQAFTAENPTLEKFGDSFDRGSISVLVRGEVTDPATLRAMARFDDRMSTVENVAYVSSPADRVRAEYGRIPDSEAKIERVLGRPNLAFVQVVFEPGLTQPEERPIYTEALSAEEWARFPAGVDVIITGSAAFSAQLSVLIQQSTNQLLGLAVGLMIVALFFLFRGVRLRLLPIVAVFVGVLYTFGAIGYAGVPNSTLTSAVFPILIGLGIDYSVQFHERYEEELETAPPREALPRALAGIGPPVFVAMLAAALGFGATWISTQGTPAFVWFAQTSIFGVLLTFLAGLIVLLPVLTLYARFRRRGFGELGLHELADGGWKEMSGEASTDADDGTDDDTPDGTPPTDPAVDGDAVGPAQPGFDGDDDPTDSERVGAFGRALGRTSRTLAANPAVVLLVAVLLMGAGFQAGTGLDTLADTEEFIPQDLPAYVDLQQFRAATGGGTAVQYDVILLGSDLRHPAVLRWMEDFERVAVGAPLVQGVDSPATLVKEYNGGEIPQTQAGVERVLDRVPARERARYYSDGYAHITVIAAQDMTTDETLSFISNVGEAIEFSNPPPGVQAELTGTAAISPPSIVDQIESRNVTTGLGVALIFGLLLAYYRRLVKAIAPLVPMFFVIGWQNLYMAALDIPVSPLGASLGALTVGIGAEYTIIVMERYYEEKSRAGASKLDAVETAATRVGKAISVSGMTTVFGFSALTLSPFPILADFGFLTVGVIFLTLVAALATLPPTLVVLDTLEDRILDAFGRSGAGADPAP
ncbi:RND family transporter [Haloplanus rubicundus]|uniref:RND family transporter n=1 Tax=Haloplanus rubicundus TaxID=1547898 RepID=A0A345E705_9EURY|nr:RND family transporter [Haloplanus rubicundus]AXG07977.1 RND family transporter [Haloplanus rubicundus]AXG11390.1 RND family transporter [Haloplanus rubicundus]